MFRSDGEDLDMPVPRARLSVTSSLPYAKGYDAAIAANTLLRTSTCPAS